MIHLIPPALAHTIHHDLVRFILQEAARHALMAGHELLSRRPRERRRKRPAAPSAVGPRNQAVVIVLVLVLVLRK